MTSPEDAASAEPVREDLAQSIRSESTPPRWRLIALGVCMFLITGVFGFLQPFVPLYLTAADSNKQQFGQVMALGTGMALLIQPILGRLSDRFDARRPFMVLAAAAAGFAYLGYRYAHTFVVFTLLTALGVNGQQYLNSVGGVLVGRMAQATGQGGAAYVKYRVWGSIGYIVIGIGAGLLVHAQDRAALDPLFLYGPCLFFLIAGVALLVPDSKAAPAAAPAMDADIAAPPVSMPPTAVPKALSNLDWFLVAYFLYQFSLYGATAYLAIYMKQLGASSRLVTDMFAAGVVSEALVMTQVGRWTDRHGRRPALAAAFLLMPLRLLLYIPATGPLWVLAVQSLHGLNFGIVGTIAIVFINDHAGHGNRGRLQARLAATTGLGNALGPLACGWIAQRWGLGGMFAAMSGVGALAAFVLLTRVRESHPAAVPSKSAILRWLA